MTKDPQKDLFGNDRLNPGPTYKQERNMNDPLMKDCGFYWDMMLLIEQAGPEGLPMRELIRIGKERKWWQDTVSQHFGEKMRAGWVYGFLVVSDTLGETGTDGKRVVHPIFFRVDFDDNHLQHNWDGMMDRYAALNHKPQGRP